MFSTPRRRQFAWFVIGVLASSLAVLTVVSVVNTNATTASIRRQQQTNTTTVDLIRDCTRPQGKCFKRGQRQTARAVADINRVTVYAAACASRMPGQSADQIQRCIVRELAKDAPRKGKR